MSRDANPFLFGALATGDAFTDRVAELNALALDMRSGQDVALVGPRRTGKSSLVRRAADEVRAEGVLVAECDLFFTPSKERLAQHLARAIYGSLATVEDRLERRLGFLRRLRVAPRVEVDPTTGGVGISFGVGASSQDVDATIEELLALPGRIAEERDRQVVLVLDEFQEVLALDADLPRLFRSVFQTQPAVAHVFLGSRRSLMRRLFVESAEPLFRSARMVELGPLPADWLAPWARERFERTGRGIEDEALARLLDTTRGHPYQTQELLSFTWARTPEGAVAGPGEVETALLDAVDAESPYATELWAGLTRAARLVLLALARESGPVYAREYQSRHGLPGTSATQRAIVALLEDDLVRREPGRGGRLTIADPLLLGWLRRAEDLEPVVPLDGGY